MPYPLLCTILGLVLGWLPRLIHGPNPLKFTILYLNGSIAVWAFYAARLLIGFVVGISHFPRRWYVRGPVCGLVMMLSPAFIALATPGCGWP